MEQKYWLAWHIYILIHCLCFLGLSLHRGINSPFFNLILNIPHLLNVSVGKNSVSFQGSGVPNTSSSFFGPLPQFRVLDSYEVGNSHFGGTLSESGEDTTLGPRSIYILKRKQAVNAKSTNEYFCGITDPLKSIQQRFCFCVKGSFQSAIQMHYQCLVFDLCWLEILTK